MRALRFAVFEAITPWPLGVSGGSAVCCYTTPCVWPTGAGAAATGEERREASGMDDRGAAPGGLRRDDIARAGRGDSRRAGRVRVGRPASVRSPRRAVPPGTARLLERGRPGRWQRRTGYLWPIRLGAAADGLRGQHRRGAGRGGLSERDGGLSGGGLQRRADGARYQRDGGWKLARGRSPAAGRGGDARKRLHAARRGDLLRPGDRRPRRGRGADGPADPHHQQLPGRIRRRPGRWVWPGRCRPCPRS
jgi:hypothetical protein